MLWTALLLAAVPPSPFAEEAEIRRLRAASNVAIAAHDVAGVMASFAPEAVTIRGSSAVVGSRAEIQASWASQMAIAGFDRFVRTPNNVEVGKAVGGIERAAESGSWTGHLRTSKGESRPFGRYLAHWSKRDDVWLVVADVYVTLGCEGAGC